MAVKHTGMTASEMVQERLVVEAKRILTHVEASIADIANALGFTDSAYFTRLFKKCTGQTTKQFKPAFEDALKAKGGESLRK
jgi:AraC family transcriptional activator of pobA